LLIVPGYLYHLPLLALAGLLSACALLEPAPLPPAPLPPPVSPTPVTPTVSPTAVPPIVVVSTPAPPPTAAPSPAPMTTPTPTVTAVPTATPVDRACPDPPPARPVYRHYAPATDPWPTPRPLLPDHHFRLGAPLVSDGRARLNEQYPYGYDGNGRYLLHNGLDFIEPLGTLLLAVADGVVVVAQSDRDEQFGWRCDWYGQLVVLQLDQTWQGQPLYVLYGHVLNIMVAPGQRVRQGQVLAELGVGGATVGAHLHLEVRAGSNEFGATRNPHLWLEPLPGHGLIAGRLLDGAGRPWQGVAVSAIGQAENGVSRATWSYLVEPRPLVNPHEAWAENFVIPDLPPGLYRLLATIQGVTYEALVEVAAGETAVVEIMTP
jgi:murein DD-endopeptidase MepM/ murein hydrolase activator NlpD